MIKRKRALNRIYSILLTQSHNNNNKKHYWIDPQNSIERIDLHSDSDWLLLLSLLPFQRVFFHSFANWRKWHFLLLEVHRQANFEKCVCKDPFILGMWWNWKIKIAGVAPCSCSLFITLYCSTWLSKFNDNHCMFFNIVQ